MARMRLPSTAASDAKPRSRMQSEARARLESLIKEQGVKPLDVELLSAMSGIWPEDEVVDEFLEARDLRRSHAVHREIP